MAVTYADVDVPLPLPDPGAPPVHVLMPCMAYACGETILSVGPTFQVGISDWTLVTCEDCRRHDPEELRADMRRQQGQQQEGK